MPSGPDCSEMDDAARADVRRRERGLQRGVRPVVRTPMLAGPMMRMPLPRARVTRRRDEAASPSVPSRQVARDDQRPRTCLAMASSSTASSCSRRDGDDGERDVVGDVGRPA